MQETCVGHWAELRRADCAATAWLRTTRPFLPTILPRSKSSPNVQTVRRFGLALHLEPRVCRSLAFAVSRNTTPRREYPRTPAITRLQQRTPVPAYSAAAA